MRGVCSGGQDRCRCRCWTVRRRDRRWSFRLLSHSSRCCHRACVRVDTKRVQCGKADGCGQQGGAPPAAGAAHEATTSMVKRLLARLPFRTPGPKVIALAPARAVAPALTERRVFCAAADKDVALYYFLMRFPGRTLVFVNRCAARLFHHVYENLTSAVRVGCGVCGGLHSQHPSTQAAAGGSAGARDAGVRLARTNAAAAAAQVPGPVRGPPSVPRHDEGATLLSGPVRQVSRGDACGARGDGCGRARTGHPRDGPRRALPRAAHGRPLRPPRRPHRACACASLAPSWHPSHWPYTHTHTGVRRRPECDAGQSRRAGRIQGHLSCTGPPGACPFWPTAVLVRACALPNAPRGSVGGPARVSD
jgi:hypothetical protein